MPYKHEEEVKSVVYGYARYSADDTVIDEVDEVYAKAKAWDNYLADVRERIKFSESTEEDIEKEMQEVVNNYMEDK